MRAINPSPPTERDRTPTTSKTGPTYPPLLRLSPLLLERLRLLGRGLLGRFRGRRLRPGLFRLLRGGLHTGLLLPLLLPVRIPTGTDLYAQWPKERANTSWS